MSINTTTAAVPYALSLTVTGTSGAISHTASTTLLVALAAPQGLAATPGNSQVALSWQPIVGASSYHVGRSLGSGGPYISLGCSTGTTWTDMGATNGTTYYYAVLGQFTGGNNAGGAGPLSWEVQATPPCAVPGYSGKLTAARSGASDTVWSWTAGGAVAFDLVRGDLAALRSTGGDSTAACVANDTPSLAWTDSDPPPSPGEGMFTLLRPATTVCAANGTYNDGSASLAASRDPEIAASSASCP
jgi:hypothetical protein